MASDVAAAAAKRKSRKATPPQPRVHFGRFYAVYVVLGLAVCAAVVGVVFAARSGGDNGPSKAWSVWAPTGGGLGLAEQIAAHVGGQYRLDDGTQAVTVQAEPPVAVFNSTRINLDYVVIRGGKSSNDVVANASPTGTVMYRLSSTGTRGSFANVQVTPQLGQLLRREALELSLYTFHYNPAIHNIVVFMPPVNATAAGGMIFFQRSDLGPQITQPLAQTLSLHTPTPQTITPADDRQVQKLTGGHAYSFTFQEAQDNNAGFILTRLP